MLLTWFSVPLPVAEICVAHGSGDIMAQMCLATLPTSLLLRRKGRRFSVA